MPTQYKPLPQKETKSTASTKNTGFKPFPFNDFRYYLTLFSKFFSSFPRGTCSLSVSRHYLAFEGIYLQLGAAVPSNSTLRNNAVRMHTISHTWDSHPLWMPSSKGLEPTMHAGTCFYRLQFFSPKERRLSIWALPASLAVTRGILVSFFSSA